MSKSFFPNKIALVGHAYSGKSSTAREISRRYGHKIISLASPIKEVDWAFSFLGIPSENKARKRKLYHVLGIWARKQDPKFFINMLERNYWREIYDQDEKVVVDDCRFINEAIFFALNYFTLIYIDCPKDVLYKRAFENGEDPDELYSYESEQEIEEIVKTFDLLKVSGVADVKVAVDKLEAEIRSRIS